MKNTIRSLTLLVALFVWCPMVSAGHILSADGSMLTGLDVNGTLYDIEFFDGILAEVFPLDQVTAPGWYELAGSVTAALYNALADMGLNDNKAIRGCEDHPGLPGFVGPNVCMLVIPDKITYGNAWEADNLVMVNQNGTYLAPPPYGVGLSGDADTGASDLGPFTTLAKFSPSPTSVPVPGSLVLTLSGLLLIAFRRKTLRNACAFGRRANR